MNNRGQALIEMLVSFLIVFLLFSIFISSVQLFISFKYIQLEVYESLVCLESFPKKSNCLSKIPKQLNSPFSNLERTNISYRKSNSESAIKAKYNYAPFGINRIKLSLNIHDSIELPLIK